MSNIHCNTLTKLLEGEFICGHAHKDEYIYLQSEGVYDRVSEWLSHLEIKLSRMGIDGAFYTAPMDINEIHMNEVRGVIERFRDKVGPFVSMFDLIRKACPEVSLVPGARIDRAEVESQINKSVTLQEHLKNMLANVREASQRLTMHENIQRIMKHLQSEGYVVLHDEQKETYLVTGKIDYYHAILEKAIEHLPANYKADFNEQESVIKPDAQQSLLNLS